MCFGNQIGFNYETVPPVKTLFEDKPGAFLVETDRELRGVFLGYTKDSANILIGGASIPLSVLSAVWQKPEEKLYAAETAGEPVSPIVPAFPMTKHSVVYGALQTVGYETQDGKRSRECLYAYTGCL